MIPSMAPHNNQIIGEVGERVHITIESVCYWVGHRENGELFGGGGGAANNNISKAETLLLPRHSVVSICC